MSCLPVQIRSLRVRGWTVQVPPEVYDLFGNAQKKGEKAEEEWKATMAKYQEKYPEVRTGLQRLSRPPLWHTLHPVYMEAMGRDAFRNLSMHHRSCRATDYCWCGKDFASSFSNFAVVLKLA